MEKRRVYDYLIVGAGLFGCVFAHELHQAGFKCLVIDKRGHLGGNTYCRDEGGIKVHEFGAHVFHTSSERIWAYVNSFVPFNRYTNCPLARYKNKVFSLPFNMNTFNQLWGVTTPEKARLKIREQVREYSTKFPKNLEEYALSVVGSDIYHRFIKGYTEKQWGREARELPAFLIKRIPLRFTYDNNYFDDRYQGIPIGGYNKLTDALLKGVDTKVNVDYLKDKVALDLLACKVVYTGPLDAFFGYEIGRLEYRSLAFEHENLDCYDYQGNAVVNFTEFEIPYTRIIEHKHFEFGKQPYTVVSREYPRAFTRGSEPFYPINDARNNQLADAYRVMMNRIPNLIFGGRLAEYKYYDMDQVIASALTKVKQEIISQNGFESEQNNGIGAI